MWFSAETIASARAWCEARAPDEAVGVVLRSGQVIPLTNAAADPRRRFEVAPREWMALDEASIAVLFHSHVGAPPELSPEDLHWLTPDGEPLLSGLQAWIFGVQSGRPTRFARFRFDPHHRKWVIFE